MPSRLFFPIGQGQAPRGFFCPIWEGFSYVNIHTMYLCMEHAGKQILVDVTYAHLCGNAAWHCVRLPKSLLNAGAGIGIGMRIRIGVALGLGLDLGLALWLGLGFRLSIRVSVGVRFRFRFRGSTFWMSSSISLERTVYHRERSCVLQGGIRPPSAGGAAFFHSLNACGYGDGLQQDTFLAEM